MTAAISAIKDDKHAYSQCTELFGIPRSALDNPVKVMNKFAVGVNKMMGSTVRGVDIRVCIEHGSNADGSYS